MFFLNMLGHLRLVLFLAVLVFLVSYWDDYIMNLQPIHAEKLFLQVATISGIFYFLSSASKALYLRHQKQFKPMPFFALNTIGLVSLCVACYLAGVMINNKCDTATPEKYLAVATDYIYERAYRTPMIKVKANELFTEAEWFPLSRNMIETPALPTSVTLFLKPGALGYLWLYDIELGEVDEFKAPAHAPSQVPASICEIGKMF